MFNVKRVMELWQSLFDADDPLKPASERATAPVDRLKEKPKSKVPSKTKKVSKKTKHTVQKRKIKEERK